MDMADEQARQTLRTALADFDITHLQKLMVLAYDRWNWESASDFDKQWFEVAEEILKERGMTSQVSSSIDFAIHVDRMVMNGQGGASGNGLQRELFTAHNGNVELGLDLKQMILEFVTNELNYGYLTDNNGRSMKSSIESVAIGAIIHNQYVMDPAIQQAMDLHKTEEHLEETP